MIPGANPTRSLRPNLAPKSNHKGRVVCIVVFFFTLLLSSFWTSHGHRCRAFSPQVHAFNLIAHRVQQSHCSSIFHRVLLTHAFALSAGHFVHKKKSLRIYTSMHSGGLELTKVTYTRFEDTLIRHRGDRWYLIHTPRTCISFLHLCWWNVGTPKRKSVEQHDYHHVARVSRHSALFIAIRTPPLPQRTSLFIFRVVDAVTVSSCSSVFPYTWYTIIKI